MTTPSLRRNALLFLLIAVLAAPWPATASPQKPRVAPAAAPSSFDFLSRSWAFLQSFWSEEGCRIDPNGRCLTGNNPKADTDTGCRLDPDGHCLTGTTPKVHTDTGCRLDPDGRCYS
jgi:hypothetical protein